MKESKVSSFGELHQLIQENQTINTVYRGHTSLDYKLVPTVGRVKKFRLEKLKLKQTSASSRLDHEKKILRYFKDRSLPYLERIPSDDWEWLAIAQHYGLATRLLDWTRNPLVAAYFAVASKHTGNSVLYAYDKGFFNYHNLESPYLVEGVKKIYPSSFARRIEAQSGLFTVHEDSTIPLEDIEPEKLHRIIITRSFRSRLKSILERYGIHKATLFPDLDGVAFQVNEMLIKDWK